MQRPADLAVERADDDAVASSPPARWALGELERRLAERPGTGTLRLVVAGGDSAAAQRAAEAAGVTLPRAAEALALFVAGDAIVAWGHDARGLVYALTELADRARFAEVLDDALPLVEQPATRVRSISRCFCSEIEDRAWFRDRAFWSDYLTMLATSRFNRFSLTLGIEYDYPYHNHLITDVYLHFPYPYLLDLPGYGIRVLELSAEERAENLAMLKYIGQEAARRGLDFQIGLWTQRYDFDDVPNANYTVTGVTPDNLTSYCRDAVAALLREVPEITGLTFRIHVEGGIAEGEYGFWREVFGGIGACGRRIEINMHAKGLDEETIAMARESGMPLSVSPKYLAEHMGLPYHPSAIREREYPPAQAMTNREKLSVGSRRFLRQSYGDMLRTDRDWQVLFRVWPGSQRVLSWGDPMFAAAYGRSASFMGADGIEWFEPLSFKGRMGSGMPGGRGLYARPDLATRHDWEKFAYQYRLWGRLGYNPDADPGPARRQISAISGDADIEAALNPASRILPLFTMTHGPSIANNNYWPEIYTTLPLFGAVPGRPYGGDMDVPSRFGNAPSFDPQMFATPREYVGALLEGRAMRSYTPLDVADWLKGLADETERALIGIRASASSEVPDVRRYIVDTEILSGMGRFFAERYRAACWAELYLASGERAAHARALDHARRARAGWATAVAASEPYDVDLSFGPGAHLRGSWKVRLPELDRELNEMQIWRPEDNPSPTHSLAQASTASTALQNPRSTRSSATALIAPGNFQPGSDIDISVRGYTGDVRLHYRHVNQGERWQSVPMASAGDVATARIPAAYTTEPYHLQVYATATDADGTTMLPGFPPSLDRAPYLVITRD